MTRVCTSDPRTTKIVFRNAPETPRLVGFLSAFGDSILGVKAREDTLRTT
jgi:hypothetical protein